MQRKIRSVLAASLVSAAFGLGATSCGGGTSSADASELVLLGFSQPNVAGVALNQALIFTFSAPIDASSITPDTLRVIGSIGPFFLQPIVDGNLVALLPRAPNFEDASDSGLAPGVTYQVSMPTFPAVDTIESTAGKPLIEALAYNFTTVPAAALTASPRYAFVESRRPLRHGTPPPTLFSDDLGCLQNVGTNLYINPLPAISSQDPYPQQTNSFAGGRLLCLENEGPPRVILQALFTSPNHGDNGVGLPSAGSQNVGRVDLPAIEIAINEQVDPGTVSRPYDPIGLISGNVRLYRVGLLDGTPIPPVQVPVNKPTVVQTTNDTKIVLVAVGPQLQGIYMVTLLPSVLDLSQKPLTYTDSTHFPLAGPNKLTGTIFAPINAALNLLPQIPINAYRYFFRTRQIPNTASALNESWASNTSEWGDDASGASEPGLYTRSTGTTLPREDIPDATLEPPGFTEPSFTLNRTGVAPFQECGQSTTANWNNGFRFLNVATLEVNSDADAGLGRLKAVYKPYLGDGADGVLDTGLAPFTAGPGDSAALNTTPGPGASVDGDGIFEFESVFVRVGDTLTVSGTNPLLILCRGSFQVDGTILLDGTPGSRGLDTDGTAVYTNTGAAQTYGDGGQGGPGGSRGGRGAGPFGTPAFFASPGDPANTIFSADTVLGGGGGTSDDTTQSGGGGGGLGATGGPGQDPIGASAGNGGSDAGTNALFERAVSLFTPDRAYSPHMGVMGGRGGGGGGMHDENNNTTPDNGDDAGAGGGGGGGAIMVLAGGQVRIGSALPAQGLISANGGRGGQTYSPIQQTFNPGPDNTPMNGDDFVTGVKLTSLAFPAGEGGPGGGGSGGAIVLYGEGGVVVGAGATLRALGGLGGQSSANANLKGGDGAVGRILLLGSPSIPVPPPSGSVTPPAVLNTYRPTVKDVSVGQSAWYDLFVGTVNFAPNVPAPAGPQQFPFFTSNFTSLFDSFGMVEGTDYRVTLEYQGAASLTPLPSSGAPSAATGLTVWSTDINLCDTRQFFRYRVLFEILDASWPAFGVGATPMPALLDLTIPFTK